MANKKTLLNALALAIYENTGREVSAEDVKGRFVEVLDNCLFAMTLAELRAEDATAKNDIVFIVNGGMKTFYYYDATDTTTADDGNNCIVDLASKRYKKFNPNDLSSLRPSYTIVQAGGTIPVEDDKTIVMINATSLGVDTPLKIGTTAGGTQILDVPDADINSSGAKPFPLFYTTQGATTLYVHGLAADVKITLIKI